ncbi:hypothetical protein P3W66_07855 [Achromobacter denitrificans]|uniref:hypothetical protein n=1 Tax=Achromobacter denitrificans TaxID=32002 RepID=UPI0023E403A8|nr:hypothetical protein [Achromobacter denitrificans]MDF3939939.1 hypothetical protein [Achromobacter denitrificans]
MDAGNAARESDLLPGDYLMTSMTLTSPATMRRTCSDEEPLFKNLHAALTFALNFRMQQYDRPLMNRVAAGSSNGEGKGLSGVDGAGQAGMIRAELDRLLPLERAVLVAAAAPSQIPCECRVSCCSGWKINPEWQDAMSQLVSAAAAGALSGCVSNGRLRSALIQRHFGADVSLAKLADRYKVSERTAEAHSAKLKWWLFGYPAKGDEPAKPGIHQQAHRALLERLQAGGMLIGRG